MQVTSLHSYPIKSLRGIDHQSAYLSDRGFEYDRRWVLVGPDGVAVTQRTVKQLARIQTAFHGSEFWLLNHYNNAQFTITIGEYSDEWTEVDIWGMVVRAPVVSREANEWFSKQVGHPVKLLYMPDEVQRPLKPRHQTDPHTNVVGFADGHQYLVTTEASLRELSREAGEEIEMNRFRPNIVVPGTTPFAEDNWSEIEIGGVRFVQTKPCTRCVVTLVDQHMGVLTGKEPLRTLARIHPSETGEAMFGVYFKVAPEYAGRIIRVGDEVRFPVRAV